MQLDRTDGMFSRTQKVDLATVEKIRKHYAATGGRNVKKEGAKFGLSAAGYWKIGNGTQWKKVTND